MAYVINQACIDIKDRACVEECPVDCIYEGNRMLYIHPDECVDYGASEPACPAEAISFEDDLPEGSFNFLTVNAEFFHDIGSPGGATKAELGDRDHPLVAAFSNSTAQESIRS